MKLGHRRNYHSGHAALRIYANQPAALYNLCVCVQISLVGAFTVIVKTDGSFAALIGSVLTPTLGPWDIVTRRNGVIIIVIGHNIAPVNDTQQAAPRGYREKVAGQGASVIYKQY